MTTIVERVVAGAELLDGIRPGWYREIDLETLNMATEDRCVLGQLWGLWKHGVDALGLPRTPSAPGSEAVPYGFDLARSMGRDQYPPLTTAWRDLIQARRVAELERLREVEGLYGGLRQVIGVVLAGLEHTSAADLGEVQHAIALLTEACALGDEVIRQEPVA